MARRLASDPPAAAEAQSLVALQRHNLPILVVDDRSENLTALSAILEPLGLPVMGARSGEEALRMLLERDFALILLDVRMPGMDGLETARLIKSRDRTRDVPILFLTAARDEVSDIVRGYDVGAVDYVLKPVDPELLRSKVVVFAALEESRRALRRSEAFLRGAFEAAPIGKTVLDTGRRIVRANPAFARLLGRASADLGGVVITDVCHPEDREALSALLDQMAEGSGHDSVAGEDIRLIGSSGRDLWVAPTASAIEPTELTTPLLLVQWVDVNARRRAEQARAELLVEQAARSQAEADARRLEQAAEQEHRIAVELQRGLLPARLPEIPGVTIAAHCEAAGLSAEVGGDWYDAFPLPGNRLGAVIGDVTGSGIRAASAMGQLRSVTRALALAEDEPASPADVLRRLNRYHHTLGVEELFTVLYMVVEPAKGAAVWATAGHPPPLLLTDDRVRTLPGSDGMMGLDDLKFVDREAALADGDTLILYTDGLVERRGEALDAGLERLAQDVSTGPREPEALCAHLVRRAQGGHPEADDDRTVLVVQLRAEDGEER